jgi:hypothetical protein
LHSGILKLLEVEDFIKFSEVVVESVTLTMENVINVGVWLVLSHWLENPNHSRLEDVCSWFDAYW